MTGHAEQRAHRRLKPNELQICPSRACHQWHTAHGQDHTCGQDKPNHRRLSLDLADCPECGGPAQVRGDVIQPHAQWRIRPTGDGRHQQVATSAVCNGGA